MSYVVSYKRYEDDRFTSTNIVWAERYEDVAEEFAECAWFSAHAAPEWEVRECRAKGMPERWLCNG